MIQIYFASCINSIFINSTLIKGVEMKREVMKYGLILIKKKFCLLATFGRLNKWMKQENKKERKQERKKERNSKTITKKKKDIKMLPIVSS